MHIKEGIPEDEIDTMDSREKQMIEILLFTILPKKV